MEIRVALQGGGALGAYGAGVLMALEEDPDIEIIEASGLSAGASNLHVFSQAGSAGLQHFWKRIASAGDMAANMDPFNVAQFMPSSFLVSGFKAAGLPTPLEHLRSSLVDSVDTHRLRVPHAITQHVSTVVKINENGGLDRKNVEEVVHSSTCHNLEVVLASSALEALTDFERGGCTKIDGVAHWDGVYSGQNPNLNVFSARSNTPVLVVSVDDPKPRRSITDPHIMYGGIHDAIIPFASQMKAPVHHISLQHQPRWSMRVRTQPSSSLVQTLMKMGHTDAKRFVAEFKQGIAPRVGVEATIIGSDRAMALG